MHFYQKWRTYFKKWGNLKQFKEQRRVRRGSVEVDDVLGPVQNPQAQQSVDCACGCFPSTFLSRLRHVCHQISILREIWRQTNWLTYLGWQVYINYTFMAKRIKLQSRNTVPGKASLGLGSTIIGEEGLGQNPREMLCSELWVLHPVTRTIISTQSRVLRRSRWITKVKRILSAKIVQTESVVCMWAPPARRFLSKRTGYPSHSLPLTHVD